MALFSLPHASSASGDVSGSSLSDLLAAEAPSGAAAASADAAKKAEAMRAALAAESALKEKRASVAIARMEKTANQEQRSRERIANSGVPPCEETVWGSGNTGLLQSKACARVRDGTMEKKQSSGFLVVF